VMVNYLLLSRGWDFLICRNAGGCRHFPRHKKFANKMTVLVFWVIRFNDYTGCPK